MAHVWFLRKSPSRIGTLLGMKLSDIEKVVYYARYIVLEDWKDADGKVKYKARQLLTDEECHKSREEGKGKVKVGVGAGAIRQLLEQIEPRKEADEVRARLKETDSEAERQRLIKRLRILDGFVRSNTRPENMVLTVTPRGHPAGPASLGAPGRRPLRDVRPQPTSTAASSTATTG